MTPSRPFGDRSVGPVVGVVVLIVVTVCLAAVVAGGVASWSMEPQSSTAAFDLSVDGERSAVTIDHVAGDPVDVDDVSLTIAIEGTPLSDQPPIPFVGAKGFDGAPTGPFNAEADPKWRVGERATLTVADTNEPTLEPDDRVTVTVALEGTVVAELEATA